MCILFSIQCNQIFARKIARASDARPVSNKRLLYSILVTAMTAKTCTYLSCTAEHAYECCTSMQSSAQSGKVTQRLSAYAANQAANQIMRVSKKGRQDPLLWLFLRWVIAYHESKHSLAEPEQVDDGQHYFQSKQHIQTKRPVPGAVTWLAASRVTQCRSK